VLDLRQGLQDPTENGALLSVCGLPLLIRNLVLLQRAGVKAAAVLVDEGDQGKVRKLLQRARRIPTVGLLVSSADGARIERELGAFECLLLWPGALSFGRFAPALINEPCDLPLMATHQGQDLGLMLLPRALVVEGVDLFDPAANAIANGLRRREEPRAPVWVRARADVAQAERELLASLRKGADGVVAVFNRTVSLAISRHLLRLPVSPNAVTIAAGLMGLGSGLAAARGGYWFTLAGALLFQLNSIVDGVDGEIARAKLLESHVGQWLDTVADDVTNLAFMLGAGIGCSRTFGWSGYLILAAIAGAGQALTSAFQYHYLVTVAGSGDLNDFRLPWEEPAAEASGRPQRGAFARFAAKLKWALRRDAFAAFSLLAALLGQLRILIWLFAAGATSVWLSIAVYRITRTTR
jgi:phosphatidylglycerophosphate synthase